jgi:hypothetical protein
MIMPEDNARLHHEVYPLQFCDVFHRIAGNRNDTEMTLDLV